MAMEEQMETVVAAAMEEDAEWEAAATAAATCACEPEPCADRMAAAR